MKWKWRNKWVLGSLICFSMTYTAMAAQTEPDMTVAEEMPVPEHKLTVLGLEIKGTQTFLRSDTLAGGWGDAAVQLKPLQEKIHQDFKGARQLVINTTGMEYRITKTGSRRLGLYAVPDRSGYRLDVGMPLNRAAQADTAAAYDYAVYQSLLYQISGTPVLLEDAVTSSWQETNVYGINRTHPVIVGDCLVWYEAADGYGKYWIIPAE